MDEIELIRDLPGQGASLLPSDGARAQARIALGDRFGPVTETIRPPRRRRVWAAAATALAAVAALVAFGIPRAGSPTKTSPEFASAAVRVAEANPRLLVTAPGWSIKHAFGFEVDSGSMIFGDGTHHLTLDWYPARFYSSYLRDRRKVSKFVRSTALGHKVVTVHYPGRVSEPGVDYETLFSPWGAVAIDIRGLVATKREYAKVIDSLRRVDVSTWLGAMPPEVVQPGALDATVRQMLRGVPLPPDFDRATLPDPTLITDRYRLSTSVTGAVTCAWLERWQGARRAGDTATINEAVDAMATARRWPVLLAMASEKKYGRRREKKWTGTQLPPHGHGWASTIVDAGREIAAGHLDDQANAYVGTADGKYYELGPAWSDRFGCAEHYRRRATAPPSSAPPRR